MNELLKLPFEIQIVLVAGYLGYKLTTATKKLEHKTEDFLLQVLVFGTLGRVFSYVVARLVMKAGYWAPTAVVDTDYKSVAIISVLAVIGSVGFALSWRKYLEKCLKALMSRLKIYHDDHETSAFRSVLSADTRWSFIQVHIDGGKILESWLKLPEQAGNPSDLQEVSDNLISLVDAVDWPIRLVVLGVPPLAELRRRDKQMEERSEIIELSPVSAAKTSRVEIWLTEIIADHAGLAMRRADFTRGNIVLVAEKLIHGCAGNAGSIIEHIRSAVEVTIRAGRTQVVIADFAQAYYNRTRCLPHDNIFEVSTWKAVPGGAAKIKEPIETKPELGDLPEQQVDDNAGFKKPKTGDRPR